MLKVLLKYYSNSLDLYRIKFLRDDNYFEVAYITTVVTAYFRPLLFCEAVQGADINSLDVVSILIQPPHHHHFPSLG